MTCMQKLELTWIGNESQPRLEPRFRLEFTDDPQREDSPVRCHEATLAVCHDPRCDCSSIQFQWQQSELPSGALVRPACDFWFCLRDNSVNLTPDLENDPESLRLAKIINAELTEPLRRQLSDWYPAAKLALIQSTPADEIDITHLPSSYSGGMIGFVEVFPSGLALNFPWNGEKWAADEQFCVRRGCKCTETVLSFLRLANSSGQFVPSVGGNPAIRYNYVSEASRCAARGPTGSPPFAGLLAALKREHPDLNSQLKSRHTLMQSLYTRHDEEQAALRLQFQAKAAPPIGRNDPCPCGSGRKYKQCCLNKPQS